MDKNDFQGLREVSCAEYHAKFPKTLKDLKNHCKYAIPHFISIINQRMDFQGIIEYPNQFETSLCEITYHYNITGELQQAEVEETE